MKKMSVLALALVVALPGCMRNKENSTDQSRRNRVEKYADVMAEVYETEDMEGFGEDADLATFDFDMDGFKPDEEEDMEEFEVDFELPESSDYMEMDTEEYSWINDQSDDEFKKLYFSFNHYGIRQDQNESLSHDIEQVRQMLVESGSSAQPTVVIEGHACQEGSPAYNLALSEKRAKNVADLFVAAGVDRSAIKVVGRGQECPAVINGKVVNGSRDDRWPNRRVEVRVIYT